MTVSSRSRLADLCEIQIGRTPSRSEPRYWGPGLPWLSIADMSQGRDLFETKETITEAAVQEQNCRLVPRGTLLFSFKLSVGKVGFARRDLYTNEAIAALPIRDNRCVDDEYLCFALASLDFRGMGERAVKGVTLNTESLGNLLIPLPPIAEQRQIAAVLGKADGLRRKRHESLRLMEEFLRSVFLEVFGDPTRNEKCWPLRGADCSISAIEAGTSVNGDERTPAGDEWAVLKISAVTSGRYLPEECKVVTTVPGRLVVPRKGDLLFSRANTRELVAATCLVDREAPRVFLPDKLWRITPNPRVATAEYLRYLLTDPGFRRTLTKRATGTSGSMLNVSQEKLVQLQLPVPPLASQQEFARIVWKSYETRDRLEQAAKLADELFGSIAQRSFGPAS